MTDETMARQQRRFRFLSALYDASGANIHALVNLGSFCEELGITPKEGAEVLVQYLIPKKLAKWGGGVLPSGWTSITLEGVEAVEAARTNPTSPTQHFAPIVQINVAQMSHSIIQTGAGSTATVSQQIGPEDQTKLIAALNEIRRRLEGQDADATELVELIADVQIEVTKPKPNRFKLWPNLQTIAFAIQTMADLGPAYTTIRGMLKVYTGIELPEWPLPK